MSQRYPKIEKLKSQKCIQKLFTEGQSVMAYPFRMVYTEADIDPNVTFKTGVSVSKRHFKKAVDRNRIKRLMREAYRLQKGNYQNEVTKSYAIMILYIGKETPEYPIVFKKMTQLLDKFIKNTTSD